MKPRSLVAGYSHPDFLTNSDTPQPRPAWDVPDLHDPCRRPVSGVDQSHGDTGRRIAPPRQFPGGPAAALCRIPHNAYRLVVLVHAEPVVLAVVQDCQVWLRRSEPEPPFTAAARRLNRNRQPKRIDDPPTRQQPTGPRHCVRLVSARATHAPIERTPKPLGLLPTIVSRTTAPSQPNRRTPVTPRRRLRTAPDHRRVALPRQAHSSAVPARIRLRRTRREPPSVVREDL